jgi:hypothetical protein
MRASNPFSTALLTVLVAFVAVVWPDPSHASVTRGASVLDSAAGKSRNPRANDSSVFDVDGWADVELGALNRSVFALALASAQRAVERGEAEPSTLTVIDYSRPSTERRLWVIDLRTRELLFEEYVSHGRNSGGNVPTSFSNEEGSYKSSLGLFRAAEAYNGKHGYSLRLDGLEKGVNDRARERAIVIHGADYVNPVLAKKQGRLGRSLGCPAVRPAITRPLIDAVKNGGLVFAYYPDPTWLNASSYLN